MTVSFKQTPPLFANGPKPRRASRSVRVQILILALNLLCGVATAADITARLAEAPQGGNIVLMLFDSANAFGDFRDPVLVETFTANGENSFSLAGLEAGEYALLVHHDVNGNAVLDKNFIGVPTEPIAFSNGYRPKGPPSFKRARFVIGADEALDMDLELFKSLGRRGRVGVGVGVIARSSPYKEYSGSVSQVIPAVTYNGDRFQIFGPFLQVGIVGSGKVRLAASASYRIGVYEEADSPFLAGMGDRESTAMAGLALQFELPKGFDLSLRYEHDVLNRIGGGTAQLRLGKGFALGVVRIVPGVAVLWLSADLSNYDFGVPEDKAAPQRPAYELGDTLSAEVSLRTFVEINRDWRVIANVALEFFDDEVTNSPIVVEDNVVKGFFALNYVF